MRDNDGNIHEVKLNGSGSPVVPTTHRPVPQHMIVSGYGLTTVDAEMFEAWMADHISYTPVRKGLIFMEKNRSFATAAAKEREGLKTGMEPLAQPKANTSGEANRIEKRTED